MGHQVYGMGGARSKNNLMGLGDIEVLLNLFSRLFILVRSFLGQCMYPSMNIGIVVTIIIYNSIDYLLGSLRSGRIIQIDQGLPIDFSV